MGGYQPGLSADPLLSVLTPSAHAQSAEAQVYGVGEATVAPIDGVVDSVEVKVLFPIGKSVVDLGYQENGERLAEFVESLRKAVDEPSINPKQIRVVGYASPDGNYQLNMRLARERAENLASYLRGQIDIPATLMTVESAGIDWQGLDRAVGESMLREKARVQYIIRHEPEFTYQNNKVVRSRKQQLQNLDGGRTWNWMMDNLYPALRSSASVVCYICPVKSEESRVKSEEDRQNEAPLPPKGGEAMEVPMSPEVGEILASDVMGLQESLDAGEAIETVKYPIAALRSNLLLPLLNVGAEVPLGNRWSAGIDYYYPWSWRKADHKNCFELIFISAETRYWFGSKHTSDPDNRIHRLTGHSVGVYGAWGYYDIEHNWRGHQGHGFSAGVDYLYAMPIAKGKLHLEFELAVGGVWSPAQPYNVREEGGKLIREKGVTKHFSYFGPTKVSVSLVLPLWRSVKRQVRIEP